MTSRLVLDASVAVKWSFAEVESARALDLYDAHQRGSLVLVAPDLFVTEITNVIWKKHVLRGEVDSEQAERGLALILAACPILADSRDLVPYAWEIAVRYRRSVYDCTYVALAQQEGCDFITADKRLVDALHSLNCVKLLSSYGL